LPKGAYHGKCESKWGSGGGGPGAEPLVRGQGGEFMDRAHGGRWGVKPPEAERAGHGHGQFSNKKWPKFEDLDENLPPCLRKTVSRRHDQP